MKKKTKLPVPFVALQVLFGINAALSSIYLIINLLAFSTLRGRTIIADKNQSLVIPIIYVITYLFLLKKIKWSWAVGVVLHLLEIFRLLSFALSAGNEYMQIVRTFSLLWIIVDIAVILGLIYYRKRYSLSWRRNPTSEQSS